MHTIILTISLRFLRRSISSRELFYQPFLSSTRIFGNFYFEMNVMVSEPETVLVFETLVRNSNLSVRRTSWLNLRTKETPNKRLRCTFTLKNVGLLDFLKKKITFIQWEFDKLELHQLILDFSYAKNWNTDPWSECVYVCEICHSNP